MPIHYDKVVLPETEEGYLVNEGQCSEKGPRQYNR